MPTSKTKRWIAGQADRYTKSRSRPTLSQTAVLGRVPARNDRIILIYLCERRYEASKPNNPNPIIAVTDGSGTNVASILNRLVSNESALAASLEGRTSKVSNANVPGVLSVKETLAVPVLLSVPPVMVDTMSRPFAAFRVKVKSKV